jgi:hypothetical protein
VSHSVSDGEFQVSQKVSEGADDHTLPPGYELRDGHSGPGVYDPYGLKLSLTAAANLMRNAR